MQDFGYSPNTSFVADDQSAPRAWCSTCRRQQPCSRHDATTDCQSTPIHTCRACGQIIHTLIAPPPATSSDTPSPDR